MTPVEWGIWTFLILRALDGLDGAGGDVRPAMPKEARSIGPGDLRLDRAGPDPFDPTGLGSIVTVRWGVRVGTVSGSVRLWIPESLLWQRLESSVPPSSPGGKPMTIPTAGAAQIVPRGELSSLWRAEAGTVAMPQGLKRLRVGGVLPLPDSRLSGSAASPAGPVDLVLDLEGPEGRFRIPTRPVPESGGAARPRGGRAQA